MTALLHSFTRATKRITDRPAALDSASWPEGLESTWNTAWRKEGLESIRDDAKGKDELVHDAAQYALDTDDRSELDYWFAEVEAEEFMRSRVRSYELATGKDAPDTMLWGDAL